MITKNITGSGGPSPTKKHLEKPQNLYNAKYSHVFYKQNKKNLNFLYISSYLTTATSKRMFPLTNSLHSPLWLLNIQSLILKMQPPVVIKRG